MGWQRLNSETVTAGGMLLPTVCATKTIPFSFFPFNSPYRTTPRSSVYWHAGGKRHRWCDSGRTVYFSTNKNETWDPCTAEKLGTWRAGEKARQVLTFQSYKAMHWWFSFCTFNLQFCFLFLQNKNKTNDGTDVVFKFCFKQYWAKYNLVWRWKNSHIWKTFLTCIILTAACFVRFPFLKHEKKNKNECAPFYEL